MDGGTAAVRRGVPDAPEGTPRHLLALPLIPDIPDG